jgi:hypothetical protein
LYNSYDGFTALEGKGVEKFTLKENICIFPTLVFSALEGKEVGQFSLRENICIFPTLVFSALEGKGVGQFSLRENIGIVSKVFSLLYRRKRSRTVFTQGKHWYCF